MAEEYKKYEYDVIVIGAGGAGLRAAIEAARSGAKTAIITKSLLGKAHTVMAEGGCAAALQNADPRDGWKVHFNETLEDTPSHVSLTLVTLLGSNLFGHSKNAEFTKVLTSSWNTRFDTSSKKETESLVAWHILALTATSMPSQASQLS